MSWALEEPGFEGYGRQCCLIRQTYAEKLIEGVEILANVDA